MPIQLPRPPQRFALSDPKDAHTKAASFLSQDNTIAYFALVDQVLAQWPCEAQYFLEQAYDVFQGLPDRSRYSLYVSRFFDFNIQPGQKILDLGSGHSPFPLATHLADIALQDDAYGRAGVPFKHIEGKPVYECDVEKTPFKNKEFDFVYCSHVLEHVSFPDTACQELMRISHRGYIETPSRGKDTFLGGARVSNHKWAIELCNDVLCFTEYTDHDLDGLGFDILQQMHSFPQSPREKAFSALVWLRSPQCNTMFLWENEFCVTVRRTKAQQHPGILLPSNENAEPPRQDGTLLQNLKTFLRLG